MNIKDVRSNVTRRVFTEETEIARKKEKAEQRKKSSLRNLKFKRLPKTVAYRKKKFYRTYQLDTYGAAYAYRYNYGKSGASKYNVVQFVYNSQQQLWLAQEYYKVYITNAKVYE